MANYTAKILSPWSAEKAFDYLVDFRNITEWDPSVSTASMKSGGAPGLGTVYAVKVMKAELDYKTIAYDRPAKSTLEATSKFLYSHDVLRFRDMEDGCLITYDATLKLRSAASFLNPLVGLFFTRLGDNARDGIIAAVDGRDAK